MKKISLHVQILIGMGLGILFAILSVRLGFPASFTVNYIKPFGTLFMNSLKMVAIPLVFASLVVGITSIEDIAKLSRIGGKTFFLYTATTVLAVVLGLGIANIVKPGHVLSQHTRDHLMSLYANEAKKGGLGGIEKKQEPGGPLQALVDFIPENLIASMSSNNNLLQVVLVAILLGIALLKIPPRKSKPVIAFFEGINEAIIELIRFIMKLAPIGVFSLLASLLVEVAGNNNPGEVFEMLYALVWYMGTVILGLALMVFVVYPLILKCFSQMSYLRFFKAIYPAQFVAFTTSSSSAALPVTMERVERHLGISEDISSFVLPLGASVNMDGTALYQGISIVFIAQALGLDLSITAQLAIVTNVTLSSIGVPGVPGGAMVTTAMLLQSVGVPSAGLALILAPERILDMCRTVVNITGDAVVAVIVASSEGELTGGGNEQLLDNEDL
jgi:Na+/H+-dicarboxylate symporter